jgi:S-(hydroxymethyl)glutathione dehydrogenase / alcohol dehydrogenase
MKAAVLFESPGKMRIEEVELDEPGPNEVVVRVGASGLCHTDLHYLDREHALDRPIVLGHEGAGEVEAVGAAVKEFQPGDHVVGSSMGFCGRCSWCLAGRPTMCEQVGLRRSPDGRSRLTLGDGTAVEQYGGLGAFAEQMLVHQNQLVKIDDDIPFDRAALVGCGVPTGVGAVIRTAKVPPGATVAVVGCGGVGLNVIQGAVIAGAERIVGVDINEGKLALAKEFGATDLINNSDGDAAQRVVELFPGAGGVDFSFEAIGKKEAYELAFRLTHRGGTTTVIGVVHGNFEISMYDLLLERKVQGCVLGSVNIRKDLPYLLNLYKAGRLNLDSLVSQRITLDQINDGYAAISKGDIARSVVVF